MAEAAISYVTQSLSHLLVQKAELLGGVRRQVEWLRDELQRMQCFLKDADAKQEDDQRVRNWVTEIRNAAYDAQDMVDTYIFKKESWRKHSFIKRYAHVFKKLLDLHKIGKEIEAFQARISDISKSCETYVIKSIGEGTNSTRERLRQLRRSSPRGIDKDIIGMEKDVAQLVPQLLKKGSQLTVVSVVGMGGIGKTTLAKMVFNHGVLRGNFNCFAWIYVSQEYKPKDILLKIIRDVTQPTKEELDMVSNLQEEELENMLYDYLQEKRYFVVLDDIWTTEAWDLLRRVFPDTDNGSKLMLTTRNREVALHANPRRAPYEMRLLSKEESWELFLRQAFPSIKSRHQSVHSNFDRYFASKPSIPGLRSLFLFHPYDSAGSLLFLHFDIICASFKLLRVLDFENMVIRHLKRLQTLDISGNVSLQKIPNMICKMESLRHLYMNALTCTGQLRIDSLRNLQTLSRIHIDNWKAKNLGNLVNLRKLGVAVYSSSDLNRFFNTIAELKRLASIRLVSVDIDNHLPSLSELSRLHSVTKLRLEGRISMLPDPQEFPPNIAQLTLLGSFLILNPLNVLQHLAKLSILRLRQRSYTGEEMTISAGGFPLLKFLELEGLDVLEELTIEKGALPRLRHLRISSCRELKELPDGIMSVTTLQELEIFLLV